MIIKKNSKKMLKILEAFEAFCLKFFDFQITSWQKKIAHEIIWRTLLRKRHTIILSCCRQIGKTEIVCLCEWFLSYWFPLEEGERYRVIFTAPEKGTSSEIYDKTKILFDKCEASYPEFFGFKEKNQANIVLSDNTRLETFGLFKGYASREGKKTTKEGRTAHKIIRDEMHIGEDDIYDDELEPAMATTGGVDIWIGNGGFRQCKAKKIIENSKIRDDITLFFYDFDNIKPLMVKEFEETKNKIFQRWIESQEKYIEDNGLDSDVVQKNLFNKWIVEVGNFISPEKLLLCRRQKNEFNTNVCDVGLDWAKSHDETVVTITDYERNIRSWLSLNGEEYVDQIDIIINWLKNEIKEKELVIKNLYCDSTGAGDTPTDILKRKLSTEGIFVKPIIFTPIIKDELGKKGLKSITTKNIRERLSYDYNCKHGKNFEKQMLELEKSYRTEKNLLKYNHPNRNDAHDDYPDSYFLSIYGIETESEKITTPYHKTGGMITHGILDMNF